MLSKIKPDSSELLYKIFGLQKVQLIALFQEDKKEVVIESNHLTAVIEGRPATCRKNVGPALAPRRSPKER